MAFFSPAIQTQTTTPFAPFFRLLEEMEAHSRSDSRSERRPATPKNIISPKFDVRELPDKYELHGEFPGLDQSNISIEFTDLNTLTIKARSERHYETSPTPNSKANAPSAFQDAKSTSVDTIPETESDGASTKPHKATVHDEEDENKATIAMDNKAVEDFNKSRQLATTPAHSEIVQSQHHTHYHAHERSVGEFYRQFTFPKHIDQDVVSASMKNGILSIVVPKRKIESRKITIGS